MFPSSQQCLHSASVATWRKLGEADRGRETETDWAADWDRKMGAGRRIERVSRVAECRADGSWYGRSSGQASAVPSRPPVATQNSHPNTLHSFSQELHEVITHSPNHEMSIRLDFFPLLKCQKTQICNTLSPSNTKQQTIWISYPVTHHHMNQSLMPALHRSWFFQTSL